MTKDELIEQTAMRLFVAIAHKDGKPIDQVAREAWHAADIFAEAKHKVLSVGRQPIKPLEPNL